MILDNGLLRLGFDNATGSLTHLMDIEGGVSHVAPPDAPLAIWKLVFRAGTDEQSFVWPSWKGEVVMGVTREPDGAQLATIEWRDMWFRHEPKCVDVIVTVRLPANASASEWRIKVNNRSKRYGLWEVRFPWFNQWPEPKEYNVAIPWYNWGHRYENVAEKHTGEFSSYAWSMQFVSFETGDRGLTIAAHDPEQHYKSFLVDPGTETSFILRVPDGSKPGVGLKDTFATIVDVHGGGWFEGCKRYRKWAVDQKWCAKGPISKRKDVPKTLKDIGLWLLSSIPDKSSNVTPDQWADSVIAAQKYYDVPVGIQIYMWHEIKFDNDYPEYFPTKPGVPEAIRKLVDAGIVAMPYINARLWDMRAKSYPGALSSTAKDPTGTPYLEIYGPESGLLTPMCTQTRLWQDTVFELCRRIYEEVGANAIYLDQVAAMPGAPCYDPTHGHPLGGGHHWHDGYRVTLQRVKDYIAQTGKELFLTTENPGDAHIDGCDAFLIWNPRQDTEVPMMTAVYSGYTLYYASNHTTGEGLKSFVMAQARDFLWGSQLGWMDPGTPDPYRGYLKKLGKLRVQSRKFLTFGELVGAPEYAAAKEVSGSTEEMVNKREAAIPKVSANWPVFGKDKLATMPAVIASLWRAEDGTLGLFMCNISESAQKHHYSFDPAAYGLSASRLKFSAIAEDGPGASFEADGGVQSRTVELEPFGVAIYEVAPV
jgi:hypothetical protein